MSNSKNYGYREITEKNLGSLVINGRVHLGDKFRIKAKFTPFGLFRNLSREEVVHVGPDITFPLIYTKVRSFGNFKISKNNTVIHAYTKGLRVDPIDYVGITNLQQYLFEDGKISK